MAFDLNKFNLADKRNAKFVAELKRNGIKLPLKYLGSGAFGSVYSLNKTKVFKVVNCYDNDNETNDEVISSLLVGKNFKNVVKIHDVIKMPNFWRETYRDFPNENVYLIIMERLFSIESKTRDAVSSFLEIVETHEINNASSRDILSETSTNLKKMMSGKKMSLKQFLSLTERTEDSHLTLENLGYILKGKNEKLMCKCIAQLQNGIKELKSIGVDHHDIHSDNIMQDSTGNFKFIDFGFSRLEKKKKKRK